jgi:hypothetical protein
MTKGLENIYKKVSEQGKKRSYFWPREAGLHPPPERRGEAEPHPPPERRG